jgi:hypothetical protein
METESIDSDNIMDNNRLKFYINRAILQLKFLEVNINCYDTQNKFIDTIVEVIEIGLQSHDVHTILEILMFLVSFYYRFVEFEYKSVQRILDTLIQGRSVIQIRLNRFDEALLTNNK